jgi:hypothetical protein
MKRLISLTLAAVLASACGNGNDNREQNPGNQQNSNGDGPGVSTDLGTSSLVEDEEATGQAVTAQVDEGISAAAEDQDGETSASLMLADVDKKSEHERYRNCTESEGTAVVDIRRSLERSFNFDGPHRSASTTLSAQIEKKRTWSKAGGEIKCAENKKHAEIQWPDVDGVSAEVTFSHNRSREMSVTNKKKNETKTASFSFSASGKRSIAWAAAEASAADKIAVQKTVQSDVTRELTLKNKKGETKSISGSIKTDAENPVVTLAERDSTSLKVLSRTIKSGKLIATGKDGGRVETSFADVVYTRENKCMATAGKISGAIYEKDATEPKVTFEINFDGESKTIVFSNGKEVVYSPEGCEFDDPEQIVEKDKAEDVKPFENTEDSTEDAQS